LTQPIGVNVPWAVREQLEDLAALKGMTLSEYMRFVIGEHIKDIKAGPENDGNVL